MNIAVFGGSGQLATELSRLPGVRMIGRDRADFLHPGEVAAAVAAVDADALVNATAYTAVDAAESDADTARMINATAVGAMAQAAAARGLPLVHVSTDYVFDGSGKRPWRPGDATAPLGVYGATKLAGEHAIAEAGGPHAVLRTSWVFSAHGSNFVKTMLRLAESRDALAIVSDQVGGPTPAADLARACLAVAEALRDAPDLSGVYHFSGSPDVSWADFARQIFSVSGLDCTVSDIPTRDYPTPAERPRNSRLDCSSTAATFGIPRPDWREGLRDVVRELGRL